MPILNDRITDQLHELLPEYMNEEGQGFKQFITAYFDFLEKGILIFEQGTDLETVGLEDGEGSVLQETETFSPSPLEKAKLLFEQDAVGQTQTGSWEIGEYVVGSTSGATATVLIEDVDAGARLFVTHQNKFIEGELITGSTSAAQATIGKYRANPVQNIQQLLDYADVDKTIQGFLTKFRNSFLTSIPDTLHSSINKRNLIKNLSGPIA